VGCQRAMSDHYAATVTGFLELLGACLVLELMLTVTFRLAIIHETPAKHKQNINKADSAPGVAIWVVTFSARKVVLRVRWPATGITAHSL